MSHTDRLLEHHLGVRVVNFQHSSKDQWFAVIALANGCACLASLVVFKKQSGGLVASENDWISLSRLVHG